MGTRYSLTHVSNGFLNCKTLSLLGLGVHCEIVVQGDTAQARCHSTDQGLGGCEQRQSPVEIGALRLTGITAQSSEWSKRQALHRKLVESAVRFRAPRAQSIDVMDQWVWLRVSDQESLQRLLRCLLGVKKRLANHRWLHLQQSPRHVEVFTGILKPRPRFPQAASERAS